MNFNVLNVQLGRVDGHNPHITRKDLPFTWTNVYEEATSSSSASGKRKLISYYLNFLCSTVLSVALDMFM